jgi:hypothetical protein
MAIAAGDGNGAQQPGSIRGKRERARKEGDSQSEPSPRESAGRKGIDGEAQHEGILEGLEKKTDSPGSSKILLPGSWNWVAREQGRTRKGSVSGIRLLRRSKLNFECGIGAGRLGLSVAKVNKIGSLLNSRDEPKMV